MNDLLRKVKCIVKAPAARSQGVGVGVGGVGGGRGGVEVGVGRRRLSDADIGLPFQGLKPNV